jgi:hypothetical protein
MIKYKKMTKQELEEVKGTIDWLLQNGDFKDSETAYNIAMNSINTVEQAINKSESIADIISRFIVDKAEQHKVCADDIMISTHKGKLLIDQLESAGNANHFKELEELDLNEV